MYRVIGVLIAVGTLIANWFVFQWVGNLLHLNGGFIATVLTSSILFHEVGHMLVLEKHGIRTYLVFLVLFGGAIPDKRDHPKIDKLPWSIQAAISLAGVMGNLALVALCTALWMFFQLTDKELALFASINGSLIVYNLIPFWIFDGGRFAKALFDSVSEDRDRKFFFAISTVVIIAAVTFALLAGQWFVNATIWICWGLMHKATHDDPKGSHNRKAMTRSQQNNWATIYAALVITGMLLLIAGK